MTFQVQHVPDSFAFLSSLADGAVDVILTDPPYSEHVHANMSSGTAMKRQVEGGAGGGIPRITLPFGNLTQYDFAQDLPRVAKRWAIAFCAVEDFGAYRDAVGKDQWVRGGVWFKPNAMGQLTGDRPAAAYEGLAIMHRKTKKQWNGRGSFAYWSAESDEFPSEEVQKELERIAKQFGISVQAARHLALAGRQTRREAEREAERSVPQIDELPSEEAHFQCNGTRGEKGRHPNQKPLKLCLELVAKFTNPGELVLDPFCGSGRIGEACVLLGRRYLGLDSDEGWVEKARARLEAAEKVVESGQAPKAEDCLKLCAARRAA